MGKSFSFSNSRKFIDYNTKVDIPLQRIGTNTLFQLESFSYNPSVNT
jgi:hypothetical protein